MSLVAPPGYQSLVLLDRSKHRNLGVRPDAARFAAPLHTIHLTLAEFIPASRHFPIVFAKDVSGRVHAFAVVGAEPGHNLATDTHGDWRPEVYCPAYVRRYPFWTTEVQGNGTTKSMICVDVAGLTDTPPHLFDAQGEPTPRWREIQHLVEEIDAAQAHTLTFCGELERRALLEPFAADLNPQQGPRRRIEGMLRVREDALRQLPPVQLAEFAQNGYLPRIYAHLMSHDNFHRLLQVSAEFPGTSPTVGG